MLLAIKEVFYHPQRSCGKVMFLHLFVSHSVHRGGLCPGGLCPGGSLSKGSLSGGRGLCLGDPPYSIAQAVCILLECILVSSERLDLLLIRGNVGG